MSLSDKTSPPLDNPIWHSMVAAHTSLADLVWVENGGAGRYQRDVSPFGAVADPFDRLAWSALDEILEGHPIVLIIEPDRVPDGWEVMGAIAGVQMEGTHLMAEPDPDVIPLGPADVTEVLALIDRTRPGPFLARTIEMGAYMGVRHQGSLIAMAGERLHPRGGRKSAPCAPTKASAAKDSEPGSYGLSQWGSGNAVSNRSFMPLPRTTVLCVSTAPSDSKLPAPYRLPCSAP